MKKLIVALLIVTTSTIYAQTKIVFLGDSLTEGYGVEKDEAYPHLLEEMINKEEEKVKFFNAGVSGSTSASGVSRLKWFLKSKPDILFLALGANDGLRGIKVSETQKNLKNIIELAKENNMKVLMAGMLLPLNYGLNYRNDFEKMYQELAKEFKIPLYPFLLKDVGGIKELNLSDGIHPNAEGYKIITKNLYPFITENL